MLLSIIEDEDDYVETSILLTKMPQFKALIYTFDLFLLTYIL